MPRDPVDMDLDELLAEGDSLLADVSDEPDAPFMSDLGLDGLDGLGGLDGFGLEDGESLFDLSSDAVPFGVDGLMGEETASPETPFSHFGSEGSEGSEDDDDDEPALTRRAFGSRLRTSASSSGTSRATRLL
jgi:hypothetical protein